METTVQDPELDGLTEVVARLLDVPMVLISTIDETGQHFLGAFGLDDELATRRATTSVNPYCRRVHESGRPLIVSDTRRRTAPERDLLGAVGYAGFPLTVDGEPGSHGVLAAIARAARRWTARDIGALRCVAALGGTMLARGSRKEVARRAAELEVLSVHDELTGLLNRRGFHAVAEGQLALARRRNMPGMLVYLDLDGLKATNDAAGHTAGDELLRAAASALRNTFREADTLGRLGGDELGVFSVDAVAPDLDVIAERLAAEVARINGGRPQARPLVWSLGVVPFEADTAPSLAALLDEGDRRMYEAKRLRQRGGA